MEEKRRIDVTSPVDLVTHCVRKVDFLIDFFCSGSPDQEFELSEKGADGLVFILTDLKEELEMIAEKMPIGNVQSMV